MRVPPGFAFVRKRQARASGAPTITAAERNVRALEIYSAQESPDPIRYGDTPARPSRMPIVTFLDIAGWLAVQRDDFSIPLFAPQPHATPLYGEQAPWRERSNINKPAAEAYGSLVTLDPTDPYGQGLFPK